MFLSTQLRNAPLFSARLSERNGKTPKQSPMRNYSNRKVDHITNPPPKIQFRKVIIERGKNSRVRQNQPAVVKGLNQSKSSFRTSNDKGFFANQSNAFSVNGWEVNPEKQPIMQINKEKNPKENQKNKFSFIQKLNNSKIDNEKETKKEKPKTNKNQTLLEQPKLSRSRVSSALSNKSRKSTFKFIKDDLNADLQGRVKRQDIKSSRIIKEDNTARPLSSASNKSSFSRIRINDRRDDIQLGTNEKSVKGGRDSKGSFYKGIKKEQKQQKVWTWQEVLQEFDSTEKKVNLLIEEKWRLIEQKLTDEKQSLINKDNFQQTHSKRQKQTQSLSRLNKQSQTYNTRDEMMEKYTFSRVVKEKNLDLEVMSEIKKLRSIELSKVVFSQDELVNHEECESIKERLEQRRSQIIERALAESMVEADLLRKYYSGQNYNGLSTSNYKVGQQNTKQKLILKLKTTKSTLIKDIKRAQEQRASDPRDVITKESQNQIKFNKHKDQDYEKFRYRHPNFKPNLQPIPQTSYQSQFFNYGGLKAYDDPYKEEQNIIFPTTNGLRNSSYRSEYKQMTPDRINFRELDAYRDKFKELNILYIPKKRSESEANTLKKKKSQNYKFMNQLEYVKRLKTESLIEDSRRKEIAQKVAKQMFMSESRKEYENPQKPPQYYMKSEIKNKNLFSFKYDFKKKVHA